jgi:hypothetical protein
MFSATSREFRRPWSELPNRAADESFSNRLQPGAFSAAAIKLRSERSYRDEETNSPDYVELLCVSAVGSEKRKPTA